MFVSGLGEVKGLGPMTKISNGFGVFRIRNFDDQALSLLLPPIIRGEYVETELDGNKKLSERLRKLNPELVAKLGS